MTRLEYTEALLNAARATLGVHEATRNSGPEIDEWLRYVHARPGDPWCVAWVAAVHRMAAVECDLPNPCPRTAGALRLWDLTLPECRRELPAPGDVFVLDTGEPGGAGHVGIVEAVNPAGDTLTTIEGNSGDAGEREGTKVVRHVWKPKEGRRGRVVGYLQMISAVIPDLVGLTSLPQSPFKV